MNGYDEASEVLRLPRPQRRLRRMADRLCEGHTVIWFLPGHAPMEELLTALEEHFRERVEVASVYVPHSVKWPEQWLMDRYRVEGDPWSEEAAEALLSCPDVPEVVVLRDLDRLHEDELKQWRRFLEDWAQINRRPNRALADRKAFLVPLADPRAVAVFDELREDPLLDKVWYWGWVTSREVRVVAAECLRDRNQTGAAALWGEAVWAPLAGADLECFLWMVEEIHIDLPLEDLLARLQGYGEERGFSALLGSLDGGEPSASFINGAPVGDGEREPVSGSQPLWLAGGLDWHDEGGYGLHSALLSMAGQQGPLLHRIWRGQTSVLLPMIDQYRIAVSWELAGYDRWWPEFLRQKLSAEDYEEDGTPVELAAEFMHIIEFLDARARTAAQRELRRNVNAVRKTRNALAHYRPVEWPQFQHVCEQYWRHARNGI